MKGKVVLITGATSGIGKETANALAQLGATIVFNTRDDRRGELTKNELVTKTLKHPLFHCSIIPIHYNLYILLTQQNYRIDL